MYLSMLMGLSTVMTIWTVCVWQTKQIALLEKILFW